MHQGYYIVFLKVRHTATVVLPWRTPCVDEQCSTDDAVVFSISFYNMLLNIPCARLLDNVYL